MCIHEPRLKMEESMFSRDGFEPLWVNVIMDTLQLHLPDLEFLCNAFKSLIAFNGRRLHQPLWQIG